MRQRRPAYTVALCGVLAAAAVAVMTLGTMIPVGTFCCPAFSGLLMIPVLDLCGAGIALCWYGAVGLLSLLLAPDREAALIFLFLGYYPVLRPAFQRIRLRGLRALAKLLLFNAAIGLLYGLLLFVVGMESVTAEFEAASGAMLILLLALGNVTFFFYDLLLDRMTLLWQKRWRKRLIK